MGHQFLLQQADEQNSVMKFFILLLAAGAYAAPEAEAEAEADPALLYSSYYGYSPYTYGYGYGLGYGYGYSPYAYSLGYYAAPSAASVYTVHGPNSYYANSAGVVHHVLGKREAESNPEPEAEADPAAWYGHYYGGYLGYYGHRWADTTDIPDTDIMDGADKQVKPK